MPSRNAPPASANNAENRTNTAASRRSSLLSESTRRSSSSRSNRSDAAVEALTESFYLAGLSSRQALTMSAGLARYACEVAAAANRSPSTRSSPSISSLSSLSSFASVPPPAFGPPAHAESSCPRPSPSVPLYRLPSNSSPAPPPRGRRGVTPPLRDVTPSPPPPDVPPVPFILPWKVPRDYAYHVPPPAERGSSDFYVVTKGYELGVFSSWTRTAPLVLGVSSAQHHWVSTMEDGIRHMERELAHGTVYLVPRPAGH